MCDTTKDSPFFYYNFIDKYKLNLFHCVHLSNSHAMHCKLAATTKTVNIVFFASYIDNNRCTISKRIYILNGPLKSQW